MGDLSIGWPQIIYLALSLMSFGYVIANDGKPRGNYSAGGALVGLLIVYPLLWWGGFFTA